MYARSGRHGARTRRAATPAVLCPANPDAPTQAEINRRRGESCLRIAGELRALLDGLDVDTRDGVAADLDEIEAVGRWLLSAQVIDGHAFGVRVTGLL